MSAATHASIIAIEYAHTSRPTATKILLQSAATLQYSYTRTPTQVYPHVQADVAIHNRL